MFQKYMERDSHSASHPTCGIWTHFRSTKVYSGGRSLCQNPQLRPQRTQSRSGLLLHTSPCILCRGCCFAAVGGTERNRTIATQIFSLLLYLLSYGPIYKALFLCKMLDSNQRPIDYQSIALPGELISLQVVEFADVPLWLRKVWTRTRNL